jgi:hypothetical protein
VAILCGALSIAAATRSGAGKVHKVKALGPDHGILYHQRLDYGRVQQQGPGRSFRMIAPTHVRLETRRGLKHFLLLPTQTVIRTATGARVRNQVVALELVVKEGKPQYYLGEKGKVDSLYSEVQRVADRRDRRRVRDEVERRGWLHCVFTDASVSFDLPFWPGRTAAPGCTTTRVVFGADRATKVTAHPQGPLMITPTLLSLQPLSVQAAVIATAATVKRTASGDRFRIGPSSGQRTFGGLYECSRETFRGLAAQSTHRARQRLPAG